MNSLQSVLYFQIAWFFIYLMVEHCKTCCLIWKAFQISSIVFYFVQRLFQIYLFWDFNWIYVSWTSIHVNHCVLRYRYQVINCLLYTSVLLTINLQSDQMSVKYLWNWSTVWPATQSSSSHMCISSDLFSFCLRFMTVLYYLNDVKRGGETAFPVADEKNINQTVWEAFKAIEVKGEFIHLSSA